MCGFIDDDNYNNLLEPEILFHQVDTSNKVNLKIKAKQRLIKKLIDHINEKIFKGNNLIK